MSHPLASLAFRCSEWDKADREPNRFFPKQRKSSHVRLSFSLVDLEKDTEIGFQRLADAIRAKKAQLEAVK